MMAANLNSAKLDSTILPRKITSIFHSDSTWWWQPSWILSCWIQTLLSWSQTPCYLLSDSLKNTVIPLSLWLKPNSIWLQTHSFLLNLMVAAILNSAILNLAMLDSVMIVFPLKFTHTCQDWFPPFAQKTFTHSFWLNLMMAAILNSAMLDSDTVILDSDIFLSSLRSTQKTLSHHSDSGFKLIQSDSNSFILTLPDDGGAILNSAILNLPSRIRPS